MAKKITVSVGTTAVNTASTNFVTGTLPVTLCVTNTGTGTVYIDPTSTAVIGSCIPLEPGLTLTVILTSPMNTLSMISSAGTNNVVITTF